MCFIFPEQLKNAIQIWVGLSGGMDSQVLLHVLKKQFPQKKISALHVHHGLHADADAWAQVIQKNCDALNINLKIERVLISEDSKKELGIEGAARAARYRIFADCLASGEALALAHHEDDQAETLFLQLLRGSGVNGLAAMPVCTEFAAGFLVRPFLHTARSEISNLAKAWKLSWIEDPSNTDEKFDRNYLRHTVFPLIKKRWPSFSACFARSAALQGDAKMILDARAAENYEKVRAPQNALNCLALEKLTEENQNAVLRYWLAERRGLIPELKQLKQLRFNLLGQNRKEFSSFYSEGTHVYRYRDFLFCEKEKEHFSFEELEQINMQENGIDLKWKDAKIEIRTRANVQEFKLPKRKRQSLKNLWQEWGVAPCWRDRIPFLFINDQCAAIIGFAIHADFLAKKNEPGWNFFWKDREKVVFVPRRKNCLHSAKF